MSAGFLIFGFIFVGIYLPLAYIFLFPAYFAYIFGEYSGRDKLIETVAFLLSPPFFIPFGIVLAIGWGLMRIFLGAVIVVLFALVAVLSWINVRFPFGGVFKAWFHAANWILQTVRELLNRLGPTPVVQAQKLHQLQ